MMAINVSNYDCQKCTLKMLAIIFFFSFPEILATNINNYIVQKCWRQMLTIIIFRNAGTDRGVMPNGYLNILSYHCDPEGRRIGAHGGREFGRPIGRRNQNSWTFICAGGCKWSQCRCSRNVSHCDPEERRIGARGGI